MNSATGFHDIGPGSGGTNHIGKRVFAGNENLDWPCSRTERAVDDHLVEGQHAQTCPRCVLSADSRRPLCDRIAIPVRSPQIGLPPHFPSQTTYDQIAKPLIPLILNPKLYFLF